VHRKKAILRVFLHKIAQNAHHTNVCNQVHARSESFHSRYDLDSCPRVYICTQSHTLVCRLHIMLHCLVILLVLITPRAESIMCPQPGTERNWRGNACSPCSRGTYNEIGGTTRCLQCPLASESVSGSTSITACTCIAGHERVNNADSTAPCTMCRPGYAGHRTNPGCTLCEPGKYNTQGLQSACLPCPAGSSSAAGSSSIMSCHCNAGLQRPVITSYTTCSKACNCIPSPPSQSVHSGFITQSTVRTEEDVCFMQIVSNASLRVELIQQNLLPGSGDEITVRTCGYRDDVHLRCRTTGWPKLEHVGNFVQVTPAVHDLDSQNPMARQVLELVWTDSQLAIVPSTFLVHWRAIGDKFDCLEIPCDPGHWKGPAGCVACTTGKYKVKPGPQLCDICERGSYGSFSTVTGATSAVHCRECGIGTTPNAAASNCQPCPVTYSAHALTSAFESGTVIQDCIDIATQ